MTTIYRLDKTIVDVNDYNENKFIICYYDKGNFYEIPKKNTKNLHTIIYNITHKIIDSALPKDISTVYIIYKKNNYIVTLSQLLDYNFGSSYISISKNFSKFHISFILYCLSINTEIDNSMYNKLFALRYCVNYHDYYSTEKNDKVENLINGTFYNSTVQNIYNSFELPLLPKKYTKIEDIAQYSVSGDSMKFSIVEKDKTFKVLVSPTHCRELLYSRFKSYAQNNTINMSKLYLLITYGEVHNKYLLKYYKYKLLKTKLLLNKLEKKAGLKKTTIRTIKFNSHISWLFSCDEAWFNSPIMLSILTTILRDLNIKDINNTKNYTNNLINSTKRLQYLIDNKKKILCIINNHKEIFNTSAKYYLQNEKPFDANGIETFLKKEIYHNEYNIFFKKLQETI
jgi:hypothetical protein